MKIAILTSGLLPVPATSGGAIETLIDGFVNENEMEKKCKIDIYSIPTKFSKKKETNYIFINNEIPSFFIKCINKIFKTNIPINYFYQKKMIKVVNKKNYDYIIIENYPELVLKLKSKKVVEYVHSDVLNKDTMHGKEILKKLYKVITVSDYIKKRVCEIEKNNKTYTVLNFIDFLPINRDNYKNNRKKYREKYHIAKDDIVYAFSGRISEEKGTLELVKAFNNANVSHSKLLIIGSIWYNCNKEDNYLNEIKRIANSNVIFTGYINHSEINEILCATDVGVVPSLCNEAAGLSVVEFMSRRNIVIASNRGGINEYLNKNNSNVLLDFKSNDGFEKNLSKAIKNVSISEKIRDANQDYSLKFNSKINYNSVINVLMLNNK